MSRESMLASNPRKTLTVDFPLEKIKEAIGLISMLNNRYTLLSANETFNLYTFDAPESLSAGSFADISLSAPDENRTSITFEIRRKVGAFDYPQEISQAHWDIENLINTITAALQMTQADKDALKEKSRIKEASKEPGAGLSAYTCSKCKGRFYASRKGPLEYMLCPHCKEPKMVKWSMGCALTILFCVLSIIGFVIWLLVR
jgi:hypothetical protein